MTKLLRRMLALICTAALLLSTASALSVQEAIDLLENYYVDDLPDEVYEAENLDQIWQALGDPYTYYMDADEYSDFYAAVESTSDVVGVGIQAIYEERGVHITTAINGGPAEKAGIQPGDYIIAVDGQSCVPATENTADRIRGEAGTQVTLTVRHPDGTEKDYTLTRAVVKVENTNTNLRDNIGLIHCNSFGSTTAGLMSRGIEQNEDNVSVWWVDLRNNSGGYSTAAVDAIGLFVGPGIHLYYRDGDDNYFVTVSDEPNRTEHPVIVLTNGYSASASELFAADIRDAAAGILVGGRTYGKGVAQIVLDRSIRPDYFTDDGLKVTSYRFYSALNNTTDMIGVIPTLLVPDSYTEAVAVLLSGEQPENPEGWLKIELSGWDWYVDAGEASQKEDSKDALDRLFEALPPDVLVSMGTEDGWKEISVQEAILMYGTNVDNRILTDVSESTYGNALNVLAVYGLLRGDENREFHPENQLTRAELCALLAQTLGLESTRKSPYSDVADTAWYAPYVTLMDDMGFVQGYGDGTFHPNETVTNEQFLTIMARFAEFLNAALYDAARDFTEVDLQDTRLAGYASWAKEGACLMLYTESLDAGIAYDDLEKIDPSAPVLREEAGAALYNLLVHTRILQY